MTIVLTSFIPYKIMSPDVISAIAMEAIKKKKERNILNVTVLSKRSSTLGHFVGIIITKSIEDCLKKNGIQP